MKHFGRIGLVYYDNQSAIHLTKNRMFYERKKQIDIRLYFIRDIVETVWWGVRKFAFGDHPTGILTKPRQGNKFKHCLTF